ncbi:helix-turn-helix domain-containing protein [Acerihabitans sp. KWT182]|uniref:Helix-turn-helix domain-containing protein n=1 Tax=Acerihabitans sp. KWT182 TaxID=3157919 RepID=A0AAU7Q647_9GAMM
MRRRLVDHGINFKTLIENTRRELALLYLEQAQGNISALSELLGYAETSALSRAFHRWYGVSPKKWQSGAGRLPAVK